jgi:hypothetical protein
MPRIIHAFRGLGVRWDNSGPSIQNFTNIEIKNVIKPENGVHWELPSPQIFDKNLMDPSPWIFKMCGS